MLDYSAAPMKKATLLYLRSVQISARSGNVLNDNNYYYFQ